MRAFTVQKKTTSWASGQGRGSATHRTRIRLNTSGPLKSTFKGMSGNATNTRYHSATTHNVNVLKVGGAALGAGAIGYGGYRAVKHFRPKPMTHSQPGHQSRQPVKTMGRVGAR